MSARKARRPVKRIRTTYYDVPVVDSVTIDEIAHRLNMARGLAYIASDEAATARAKENVEKVEAEFAACFQRLTFRAIEPSALNDLLNAHPATDEQIAEAEKDGTDKPNVDLDPFNVAYLHACITDDLGMSQVEWRAWLWDPAEWTAADRNELFAEVHAANRVGFHAGIPKG